MPTVAVPLLSLLLPLPTAVAAVVLPVFITNLSQVFGTDRISVVLRVLWPILAGTVGGVLIGVHLLTGLSPDVLKPIAGVALIVLALLMLLAPKLSCPDRYAPIASPLAGVGSGILGGLAGQSAPVMCLYLLSRGINGNRFVQYLSLYLVITSTALTIALGKSGALGWSGVAISAACTIPIVLGMWVGQRLRAGLPTALSRKLVLGVIVLGGISMTQPAVSAVFAAPVAEAFAISSWYCVTAGSQSGAAAPQPLT
ncbi:MAG: sulfite exporter TauE/SafE family protein [Stellaceae bacterium]